MGGSRLSPLELEQYLHSHIPITKAMQLRVVAADEKEVVLAAPLEPNINHRDTVFGGSAASIATLAAWSLLHMRLTMAGIDSRLVIHRNTMEYRRPITGEFTARARLDDEGQWDQFIEALTRRGKARMRVSSVLEMSGGGSKADDDAVVGRFEGDFVALGAGMRRR